MGTRSLKAATERREIEAKRKATVMGVEGGALKVTRAEMSHFVELRLQRLMGEEIAPTVVALFKEDPECRALLADLVHAAVAAFHGTAAAGAPEPVGIIGLDGHALSSTAPHAGLVLPGED